MSLAMPRAPSPSPSSRYSTSLQASPAPFLSPQLITDHHHHQHHQQQQPQRPLARRVHSLQNPSRPAPYPFSSPPSPTSSNSSNGSNVNGGKAPGAGAGAGLKRPGAPQRSHSFCATGSNTTFALASTTTSSHLSFDKRKLVAPPLERTLSSFGSKGNTSPPNQQMQRPFPGALSVDVDAHTSINTPILRPQGSPTRSSRNVLGSIDGLLNHVQDYHRPCTPPTPLALPPAPAPAPTSIPTILISPSLTPPRPSLATYRTSSSTSTSTASSPSSSYTILTPAGDHSTPRQVLFRSLAEDDEGDEGQGVDGDGDGDGGRKSDADTTIHTMTGAVDHLSL